MKLALIGSMACNVGLACAVILLANRMGYLGRMMVALEMSPLGLPTDTLADRPEWQEEVKNQLSIAQNQRYKVCLFGDSISSGLGNAALGQKTFNFAIAGMSTVSQLEQFKMLTAAQVKCGAVLLAIGTNDAAYRSTDAQFVQNMRAIITQAKTQLNAQTVAIIPAFFSTVEASHDPSLAGPLHRVNRVNALMRDVATQEKALSMNDGLEALFEGQALKQTLTADGVHLNPEGEKIYREALVKMTARLD